MTTARVILSMLALLAIAPDLYAQDTLFVLSDTTAWCYNVATPDLSCTFKPGPANSTYEWTLPVYTQGPGWGRPLTEPTIGSWNPTAVNYPGVRWLWPRNSNGLSCEHAFFRHVFSIPEGPPITGGILEITTDNEYIVYLNGVEIGRDGDCQQPYEGDLWRTAETYVLSAGLFAPGTTPNLIAVHGYNNSNIAGVRYRMRVFFSPDSVGVGDMVSVPAGSARLGSDIAEGDADERPEHDVGVDAFYLDRYEVTTVEYRAFIDAGGYSNAAYWSPAGWQWLLENNITQPDGWNGTGLYLHNNPDLYPTFPVQGISWFEADAFARWAGKRLPTEAEWEKAARGGCAIVEPALCGPEDERAYPWGEALDGSKANYYNSGDPFGNLTSPVGYFNGTNYSGFQTFDARGPYGTYDNAGNVWEWTSSRYAPYPYSPSDGRESPPGSPNDSCRVLRGGAFSLGAGDVRNANRFLCIPCIASFRNFSTGFRCVASAVPSNPVGCSTINWKHSQVAIDCSGPVDPEGRSWSTLYFNDGLWETASLPEVNTINGGMDRYYRGAVWFDTLPSSATLSFSSDDGLELHFNGVAVASGGGACHQPGCTNSGWCGTGSETIPPVDVTALLRPGLNVIAAHVSNWTGGLGNPIFSYFDCQLSVPAGQPCGTAPGDWIVRISDPSLGPPGSSSVTHIRYRTVATAPIVDPYPSVPNPCHAAGDNTYEGLVSAEILDGGTWTERFRIHALSTSASEDSLAKNVARLLLHYYVYAREYFGVVDPGGSPSMDVWLVPDERCGSGGEQFNANLYFYNAEGHRDEKPWWVRALAHEYGHVVSIGAGRYVGTLGDSWPPFECYSYGITGERVLARWLTRNVDRYGSSGGPKEWRGQDQVWDDVPTAYPDEYYWDYWAFGLLPCYCGYQSVPGHNDDDTDMISKFLEAGPDSSNLIGIPETDVCGGGTTPVTGFLGAPTYLGGFGLFIESSYGARFLKAVRDAATGDPRDFWSAFYGVVEVADTLKLEAEDYAPALSFVTTPPKQGSRDPSGCPAACDLWPAEEAYRRTVRLRPGEYARYWYYLPGGTWAGDLVGRSTSGSGRCLIEIRDRDTGANQAVQDVVIASTDSARIPISFVNLPAGSAPRERWRYVKITAEQDTLVIDRVELRRDAATVVASGSDFPQDVDPALSVGPSPFRETAAIRFSNPGTVAWTIRVYDVTGRVVSSILERARVVSAQPFLWRGVDGNGHRVAAGTYFVLATDGVRTLAKKVSLLR